MKRFYWRIFNKEKYRLYKEILELRKELEYRKRHKKAYKYLAIMLEEKEDELLTK